MRIGFSKSEFYRHEPVRSIASNRRRTFPRGRRTIAALALLVVFDGQTGAQGTPASAGEILANLTPPDGAVLIFELEARGDQIYACEAKSDDAAAFAWTFKAPEAELFNVRGEVVGTHFAGPTWQGNDGSAVVGSVLERADSPETGAIPWLLLEATDHAGGGVFSTISHIQRLATVGGSVPTEGCDADHAGDEVRVPYEAVYAFYYAGTPTTPDAATPST